MYKNGFLGSSPRVEDQFDKVRPNWILQANVTVEAAAAAAVVYHSMETKELSA